MRATCITSFDKNDKEKTCWAITQKTGKEVGIVNNKKKALFSGDALETLH